MTNADSPLSKKKVREAVSLAIDRNAIVKARGFGFWSPTPPGAFIHKSGLCGEPGPWPVRPEKGEAAPRRGGLPERLQEKLIAMPAFVDKDAVVAVQRFLGDVGIQCELEFPDGGGYMNYRFKNGWHNAFLVHAVRMLATTNIYNDFMWNSPGMFPSLKRPDGFLDKVRKSLETLMPDKSKMEELMRMLADDG